MIASSERFGSFLFVLSFFLKSYLHKTSHSGVWFVVLFSFQRSSAAWRLVYLTKSPLPCQLFFPPEGCMGKDHPERQRISPAVKIPDLSYMFYTFISYNIRVHLNPASFCLSCIIRTFFPKQIIILFFALVFIVLKLYNYKK